MKPFSIIVAFDSRNGISKNGRLAWGSSLDLKHFKKITTTVTDQTKTNAVIMGRKTWDSLPEKYRPLPGRVNMVLSKNNELDFPYPTLCSQDFEEALSSLSTDSIESVFVIGGAQIYAHAIAHPLCQKLYITHLKGEYGCDKFFPPISKKFFLNSSSDDYREGDIVLQFCEYSRY